MKWCRKWSVEVNVEKYRVMHMRKKVIALVENYKYLGCVLDQLE